MGARFSTPVQTDPGAYPASYTMGAGSFPGVKWPWCGVDHPPHLAEVKERVELYLYSPYGPLWPVTFAASIFCSEDKDEVYLQCPPGYGQGPR